MSSFPESFHPAVRAWFAERFPGGPTEPQRAGLAAHRCRRRRAGGLADRHRQDADRVPGGHRRRLPGATWAGDWHAGSSTSRPLRALAADVHENLQVPLAGIAAEAARLGLAAPDLRSAVRTGDTPAGRAGGHAPDRRPTSW